MYQTIAIYFSFQRDQVSLLQKEIEHLNDELNTKKQEFIYREKELQEVVNYWHEQVNIIKIFLLIIFDCVFSVSRIPR